MPKATIQFKELIQDSQTFGSDDAHMVSRVFFDLQVDDKRYPGVHANIRQKVGAAPTDPIEVFPPAGYAGPFDQKKFQAVVGSYFRTIIGKSKPSARPGKSAKSLRIRDCRHRKAVSVSFQIR